ncbi:MAG: LysM peptidoglycan-binding domain-containing protein [Oscillospiraceae bacterium]|nr:LysM peptidoglycan-binding domain-containing protein [Ruminococcus sp.]MCD8345380.1 LysM peptidoglycan-binding domain-containing protein [Oscillospiraceae bacterium]
MSINDYPAKLTEGYYYVRTAWEDESTQIGQYRTLKSAVAKADENPGCHIFTSDGIAIYPEDEKPEESTQGEEIVAESTAGEITEVSSESGYPNNGNTDTILYARANTLFNVRTGNSLDAERLTTIKKGTIVEVLERCDGWYRIKCDEIECGYAYVSNTTGTYFNTGTSLYTVQPTDSLWKISEKTLGNGARYMEIRNLNNLNSNYIRVGMQLLIP